MGDPPATGVRGGYGAMTAYHRPVMGDEVVDLLSPVPAGWVVDGTVGGGGHAALILAARPDCSVLGIDRDAEAVEAARSALAPYGARARIVHGGFEDVAEIATEEAIEGEVVGVLLDLGVSSPQLDRPERGFAYRFDAPLDMRMDARQPLTAEQVVNDYDEDALAAVITRYGEERWARRIAQRIVAARPVRTTRQLVDVIRDAIPAAARRRGGHPARRTFQAIRMEVNREMPNLAEGLDESVHLITPHGRMLVLAYHSLEDRLVKERFAEWSGTESPPYPLPPVDTRRPITRLLTRRPRRPGAVEVAANPRAESARLRAVEKLPPSGAVAP